MSKKVLIVGGFAGGASAATRLRRLDEEGDCFYLNEENIFLTQTADFHYIGDVIKDKRRCSFRRPKNQRTF